MSWDIDLEVGTVLGKGGGRVFSRNYTHNMNGAIRDAWDGKDWRDFEGERASKVLPSLKAAIAKLEANPEAFRKYEPDNKWGSVETLLSFLRDCADAMARHPSAIIRVSA